MTVVVQGARSYFFTTQAQLVPEDRDVASWATPYIVQNPAIKWIVAKYVEADNANYNGQLWRLSDLQMKKPTILHSPMNVNHEAHNIVGTFPNAELMYPVSPDGEAAAQQLNPYVEVLGAFWRFYFPDVMEKVQAAFDSGQLFTSMECVSDTVTCAGDGGCGMEFAYEGPRSKNYCAHLQEGGVRQLNDPHFLAGALIIPPVKPGWGGASVNEISTLIKDNIDEAERVYNQLSKDMSHLEPSQWEATMIELLHSAKHVPDLDSSKSKKSSKKSGSTCAACGAATVADGMDQGATCPDCGATCPPDAKHCPDCGCEIAFKMPADAIGRKIAREILSKN